MIKTNGSDEVPAADKLVNPDAEPPAAGIADGEPAPAQPRPGEVLTAPLSADLSGSPQLAADTPGDSYSPHAAVTQDSEVPAEARAGQQTAEEPTSVVPDNHPLVDSPRLPSDAGEVSNSQAQAPAVEQEQMSINTIPFAAGSHRLPNGMVGRDYQTAVDLTEWGFDSPPESDASFEERLAEMGLTVEWSGLSLVIKGTPNTQGDHDVLLQYSDGKGKTCHKKVSFLVNPDPKSLWKEIEPAASLTHRKPHTDAASVVGRDFRLLAASRRGRSHAHEGKFREDDFAISATHDGWHFLIVADGAGSAPFSREGSRLACTSGLQALERNVPSQLEPRLHELLPAYAADGDDRKMGKEIKRLLYESICGAAFEAYKTLEGEAAAAGRKINDFATTFLLSAVKKFEQGVFVASFWVGDGAIVLIDRDGQRSQLLGTPDGGDFSGQTRFLTMREIVADGSEMLRRVHFTLADGGCSLILMTDGISDPKFGTDKNLASNEKWAEFWQEISSAAGLARADDSSARKLIDWMDFWSPGEHDDRTIAILC